MTTEQQQGVGTPITDSNEFGALKYDGVYPEVARRVVPSLIVRQLERTTITQAAKIEELTAQLAAERANNEAQYNERVRLQSVINLFEHGDHPALDTLKLQWQREAKVEVLMKTIEYVIEHSWQGTIDVKGLRQLATAIEAGKGEL